MGKEKVINFRLYWGETGTRALSAKKKDRKKNQHHNPLCVIHGVLWGWGVFFLVVCWWFWFGWGGKRRGGMRKEKPPEETSGGKGKSPRDFGWQGPLLA